MPPVLQVVIQSGQQRVQELVLELNDASNRMQFLYEKAVGNPEYGATPLLTCIQPLKLSITTTRYQVTRLSDTS